MVRQVHGGSTRLVFEMSQVAFMDGSGIAVLLQSRSVSTDVSRRGAAAETPPTQNYPPNRPEAPGSAATSPTCHRRIASRQRSPGALLHGATVRAQPLMRQVTRARDVTLRQ